MNSVYRLLSHALGRLARRGFDCGLASSAAGLLTVSAALTVAGCGGPPVAGKDEVALELSPRRFALADFLASHPTAAVDISVDGSTALARDASGGSKDRSFLLDVASGRKTALDSLLPSVAVGLLPNDGKVVLSRPEAGRFLGWAGNGSGYFLVRSAPAGGPDELIVVGGRTGLARSLFVAPAGFRIAAVAARGDRLALTRELDPESSEVYLYDAARGDTRLLLPVDADGLFRPVGFSADGTRMYLFADDEPSGDGRAQLAVLDLGSGALQRRSRPGCVAQELDLAADGATYALQWSCKGTIEAGLFESETGAELGALPLPAGTRLARALPAPGSAGVLYEVASERFPRDLMFAHSIDADADARPLTFGLAPSIAADDLVVPQAVGIRSGVGSSLPAELWWPRRPAPGKPALVWIEGDSQAPAWREFHPFIQFLANRGVAVLRLRLRGARGFGRSLRHAADGRLLDAALEDISAARAELVRRGCDPQRLALLGEGAWGGAMAAASLSEARGQFAAAVDLGGDPDPLRRLDELATLPEPARGWWATRLGDPASPASARDRQRARFPALAGGLPLFSARDMSGASWSSDADSTRLALPPSRRADLSRGLDSFSGLDATGVESLWQFLAPVFATRP
ncbi:MAG: prolyl oligopeptidase family serine peptidase [Thermoanaerobaculia bacterium]